MERNNTFQISLIVSAIIHGLIFVQLPYLGILPPNKVISDIEVNYYQLKSEVLSQQIRKVSKDKIQERKVDSLKEPRTPPPFLKEDVFFKRKVDIQTKPILITKGIPERKISLPAVESDKIHSPSYLNYYQKIREKIKDKAYQNYTRMQKGEVYLNFVILSNGRLKDVRLVEDKSIPNVFLKEIALKSIKEASPYPTFPKELDYPQLTFNVIISFEFGE